MTPLRIVARVPGPLSVPYRSLPLDSLLIAQQALRSGLPPLPSGDERADVEIPVQMEPGGRFHLCSEAQVELVETEVRYANRRTPIEQYRAYGVKGTVNIATGEDKSYRIALEVGHIATGELEWFAMGDRDALIAILDDVISVGKKRSHGFGEVRGWSVEPFEPWDGFPVVRDGKPLRRLPLDYPGLVNPRITVGVLAPPYWGHARRELLAVP